MVTLRSIAASLTLAAAATGFSPVASAGHIVVGIGLPGVAVAAPLPLIPPYGYGPAYYGPGYYGPAFIGAPWYGYYGGPYFGYGPHGHFHGYGRGYGHGYGHGYGGGYHHH